MCRMANDDFRVRRLGERVKGMECSLMIFKLNDWKNLKSHFLYFIFCTNNNFVKIC